MAGNMILFAFCIMIARWIMRLKLKKNADRQAVLHALWILPVVLVFLLVNMLLAVAEYSRVRMLANLDPVLYESVLHETGNGEPVIIFGKVSPDNPVVQGDYIAYMDEQALWSPKGIVVDLDRGNTRLANDNYTAINWPVDASANAFLQAGQVVTVFGHTGRSTIIAGTDRGREVFEVTATDVFAGSVDGYVSYKSVYKGSFLILIFFHAAGLVYVVSLLALTLFRLRRFGKTA